MSIVTAYPLWFSIFCLLAGICYAVFLYYSDKRLNELPSWLRWGMASLRFLTVSVLCFLLLSPLLKTESRQVEKPVVIIAQDNSASLLMNKDSGYYKGDYLSKWSEITDALKEKYEVVCYTFGENTNVVPGYLKESVSYSDKQTDMSLLFDELDARYSNRNVGAVVVAGDGIYNKGNHPVYASAKLKVPVYTVALGDTNVRRDAVMVKVTHNKLAYLGNKFPLEVTIGAALLKGKTTTLSITKNDKELFSQKIDINAESFLSTIPLQLEASETGIQRYSLRITAVDGEVTLLNNARDIFVEVLDGREKILIMTNAPHPDVAALKSAIESKENYEVDVLLMGDYSNQPLKKYNLVVLHQLPAMTSGARKIVADLTTTGVPLWLIGGDVNAFPAGIQLSITANRSNDAEPVFTEGFSLFTVSDELKRYIKNLPAVQCPFGNYKPANAINTLLSQKIGVVETPTPLLFFNQMNENKYGVFIGEGLWKWRLRDYADHGNHQLFDELVSKIVQYLSVKNDKSFFRITTKSSFNENEPVTFEAEVYNESYELVNTPEVNIEIVNAGNKKYPYSFSKTTNAYRLNAGQFPVGEYQWEAKVKQGEKVLTQKGRFAVNDVLVENSYTVANHELMYNLAKNHGGEMFYASTMSQLIEKLNSRDDIKTVSYTQKQLSDMINLKAICLLLLALLSLEWFLRKRNGAY